MESLPRELYGEVSKYLSDRELVAFCGASRKYRNLFLPEVKTRKETKPVIIQYLVDHSNVDAIVDAIYAFLGKEKRKMFEREYKKNFKSEHSKVQAKFRWDPYISHMYQGVDDSGPAYWIISEQKRRALEDELKQKASRIVLEALLKKMFSSRELQIIKCYIDQPEDETED